MPTERKKEERKAPSRPEEKEERSGEGGASDLKQREYRDEQGQVHHHTRKYAEQHQQKK